MNFHQEISNKNLLFKSKRFVNIPLIVVLGIFLLYSIYLEIEFIQGAINYDTKIQPESQIDEKINHELEKSLETIQIKDSLSQEIIKQSIIEQKLQMEQNRRKENRNIMFFIILLFGIFILLLLKILFDILIKKPVHFYLTERQFIIRKFNKTDAIDWDKINKIIVLGKANFSGLLYNKDIPGIIVQTENEMEDRFIPAPHGAYKNICEFVEILQEVHPEKLIIKPLKIDKNKIKALFLGVLFGLYIIIRELDKNSLYALLLGGFIIGGAIFAFNKKEKSSCPAIYKTEEE